MISNYSRIVVVGLPGSGKSTFSSSLAAMFNLQHVELDAIFWQPNWVSVDKSVLKDRVDAACPPDGRWVVDGNYRVTRPAVWGRADTLV
jgi:adenylate kinase family enzyme